MSFFVFGYCLSLKRRLLFLLEMGSHSQEQMRFKCSYITGQEPTSTVCLIEKESVPAEAFMQ